MLKSQQSELLTQREREILQLVSYEYNNQDIAKKLYISFHTVISHRKNILSKLDVKNTAGMIRKSFELNILS